MNENTVSIYIYIWIHIHQHKWFLTTRIILWKIIAISGSSIYRYVLHNHNKCQHGIICMQLNIGLKLIYMVLGWIDYKSVCWYIKCIYSIWDSFELKHQNIHLHGLDIRGKYIHTHILIQLQNTLFKKQFVNMVQFKNKRNPSICIYVLQMLKTRSIESVWHLMHWGGQNIWTVRELIKDP